MTEMRICPRCGDPKGFNEFSKAANRKDGWGVYCKECRGNIYQNEKAIISIKQKDFYCKNAQRLRDKKKIYRKSNPDIAKKWWASNPEKIKQYKEANRPKQNGWAKKSRDKKKHLPNYKINNSVGSSMYHYLKTEKNGLSWTKIVPYTIEQLKSHLKKQFKPGMTWDNYGKNGWEIDHIIPRTAFNFTSHNDIDFQKCWSLKNLQPLWRRENVIKKDKLIRPFQPSLTI